MYPRRCRVAKGANLTVVVRRREGLNGALRGSGFGPCTEAVIFRVDVGEIRVDVEGFAEEGISR
jgi:hypothetical protein